MNYKNTYKLLLMGGLAPVQMEVCADDFIIGDKGVYYFKRGGKTIAYYPIATTIIKDIEENSNYTPPEQPDVDVEAIRRLIYRNNRR